MKGFQIFLILFLSLFITNAYALEVFKTDVIFSEKFDNASMPSDVAFTDKNGSFVLYDGMKGTATTYYDFKRRISVTDKAFLGGTCFKNIGNLFYFCKPFGGISVLDNKFKIVSEINLENSVMTDVIKFGKKLFCVDKSNHRLDVIDAENGTIIGTFGERGSDLGYFNFPFSLDNDKDGFLFVSDVLNSRIQMVSPEMKSVLAVAGWGIEPGQSYRPKGVAVYKDKYLFISDGYLGIIQVFDINGRFIGVLGDEKMNIKRYQSPTRIRVQGDVLMVVDPFARLIEAINIGGVK